MIVVRDVFTMKFGKARDVKALMKEANEFMSEDMQKRSRVLFDLIGPAYTMVWEMTYANLTAWEAEMSSSMDDRWRVWYQKLIPLMDKSYREVLSVM